MYLKILNDTKQYPKYVTYTVERAGLLGRDTSTGGVIPSFSVALCYHLEAQAFQEKSTLVGQLELNLTAPSSFKMSGITHLIQHCHIPKTDMNHKLCCHGNMKPHTLIIKSLMSFRTELARKLPNLTICYKTLHSRTYQPDQIQYKP